MSQDWFIHHLRFSLLGLPHRLSDVQHVWDCLQWEAPHRQVNHSRKKITEWTVCNARWNYMLRIADQRIDVFQQAKLPSHSSFGEFTDLRSCEVQIREFSRNMLAIKSISPAGRVALGGQLWLAGETPAVCAGALNGYLKNTKIPDGAEDFLYRINQPLTLGDGRQLNRILTWSIISRRNISFQPDGTHLSSEEYAAQMTFDFSNRSPSTQLDSGEVENLLNISTSEAIRASKEGEPE